MRQITQRVALSTLGIVAGLLIGASPAAAQTQTCQFPISAPGALTTGITISQQGVHCLMTDVNTAASFTSGNAIEIAANNVIFDLNGHKVGGLAAGAGTLAIGIFANQRHNITIKNGTVRGFATGIALGDPPPFTTSSGHRVEGVRAEQNTEGGIEVAGQGNIVRGNQVVATGGSSQGAVGILVFGPGARVQDNDVIETVSSGFGSSRGIMFAGALGAVIEQNRVGNQTVHNLSEGIAAGSSGGVFSTDGLVIGNRILGYQVGVRAFPSTSANCRDNFFAADVTTKLADCTDVANNN